VISIAVRGKGGRALSRHLLKPENDVVEVIPPRGLGSDDLHGQLDELVAMSLGGGTDKPIWHVNIDPDLELSPERNEAARTRWWELFEAEFGLTGQPYCGAAHVKHGREFHEHRVYSLVKPDGRVVDLSFDYPRREKISRRIEHELGLAPVHSKHARTIEATLRGEGHIDAAEWIAGAGLLECARPVAPLSPTERLIEERTGVRLGEVRAAALAAWKASTDGEGFARELATRGLRLHAGRAGPVLVDASGTAHLATRIIGASSRQVDGNRIPAREGRDRLAGLNLSQQGVERGRHDAAPGAHREADRGAGGRDGAGGGAGRGGADGGPRGDPRPSLRPDDGHGRRDAGLALDRLRALPRTGRRALYSRVAEARLRNGLRGLRRDLDRIDRERARQGNGRALTDMWCVGQV
jgi:hypothetical protein